MWPFLLAVFASHARAQDIKVLEDSTPVLPPGVVHFVANGPDPARIGVVRATDMSAAGEIVVVEHLYEDLCTTPCVLEVPADWHDLRFSTGARAWERRVEVTPGGQTVTVRPMRRGLFLTGGILTSLLVTAPVGVPMFLAGVPRVKHTEGPPPP